MFARNLARIITNLPSSVKFRLNRARPIYTFVMGFGQPAVEVRTLAGPLLWKIDRRTMGTYVLATYEPYMQQAFLRFVRPGAVVYDVGAHAGFLSLLCGLLVGPAGRVVAFEPHPANRVSIERQVRLNPALRVSVFPYALSDRCGTVRLDTRRSSSRHHVTEAGDMSVEARTIDSLVSEGRIPPPDLIKIDVEGHDGHVIRGSMESLRRHGPVVLCDYNTGVTPHLIGELLTPLGYRISAGPPITALPGVG